MILEVKKDTLTQELYIELPEELLNNIGWKTGDEIKWIDNKNGSFTLKKK
jgi:hypothetical protein